MGTFPDFLRIQVVYEEVLVKDSFVGWPYPRMLSIELQDTGAPPRGTYMIGLQHLPHGKHYCSLTTRLRG